MRLLATRSVRILTVPLLLAGVSTGVGVASVTAAAAATSTSAAAAGPTLSEFYGVSCTSPKACTAVGSSGKATTAESLAERWNGTNWTIQPTPKPAGATTAQLNAVSCTSPTACIAVGFSRGHSGLAALLAERWNGTKWVSTPAPKPAGAVTGEFYGVSCTSPTACTAVGNSNYATSLAERWNGKTWTVQPIPKPAGPIYKLTFLNSVSCTSSAACTAAVGESDTGLAYTPKNTTYLSLAERWNGKTWAIETTPRAAAPIETMFYGVSCKSPTACTAVGTTFPKDLDAVVLAEKWNGKTWTAEPTPGSPSSNPVEFASVSCTSPTACTAVGDATPEGYGVIAERWNGANWAITPALAPSGEHYPALYGVSCTSSAACTAVGQANNGAGTTQALLSETWNGKKWTTQRTPTP